MPSRRAIERDFYPRITSKEGNSRNGNNPKLVDVDFDMLMREAMAKFNDNNMQMLPLLLDRNTHLVCKIMSGKKATLKNVFGDKRYLQYP